MSNPLTIPPSSWHRFRPTVDGKPPSTHRGSPNAAVETATPAGSSSTEKASTQNATRRHLSPSYARAPEPQHRHDVADWGPAYLAALEVSARKGASAKLAGVTLRTVQRRRESDPAFAAQETTSMRVAADLIEDEVTRRAVEGVEEPVFGSGGRGVGTVQVGTIRRYSDTLLLRLAERTESGSWRAKQQITPAEPCDELLSMTRAERKARLEAAITATEMPL